MKRSPAPKRNQPLKSSSSLSRGKGKRRTQPRRDWAEARAKVDAEGRCRVCKVSAWKLEAAHVVGREHDAPYSPGGTRRPGYELHVWPDRVLPLCGTCHSAYDCHEIDLLPVLSLDEQLQAVADAGGIALALRRISGRDYDRKEAA